MFRKTKKTSRAAAPTCLDDAALSAVAGGKKYKGGSTGSKPSARDYAAAIDDMVVSDGYRYGDEPFLL